MSSCKECIHHEVCSFINPKSIVSVGAEKCMSFSDKNLYLKTPCKKGTVLYRVTYPYRSEPKVTEFVVVGFATMGKKHSEVYVQVRVNGVQGVNVMRFRQFHFNREDAEKELQEVLNGKSY